MLSFLSRLRFMNSEPVRDEAADDTSSLNRSLNLPWPVTESSARRPSVSTTTHVYRAPTNGQPPVTISNPVPRTVSNSLTGIDAHNGSSGGVLSSGLVSGLAAGGSNAWYEPEKPRRLGDRSSVQTVTQADIIAPPAVVRLDSEAFIPVGSDDENEDDNAPPRYSSHRNISTDILSEPSLPYSTYATAPADVVGNIPAGRPPTRRSDSRPDILHSEYDEEEGGELYTSPFDSDSEEGFYFPVPPRSTSTASVSSGSRSAGNGSTMAKSRWALKLQLHNAQSMPALQTNPESSSRHISPPIQSQARSPPVDQRLMQPSYAAPPLDHTPTSFPLAVSVETDVYKHAYNYPLAKQLSPIAEQDYFSPAIDSPTRAGSLRFARSHNASTSTRKASPGAESLGSASTVLLNGGLAKDDATETVEKESLKTRTGSVRTGSGGSVATVNGGMSSLSRAGSTSMGQLNGSPSEITRPSPIYASPFLTRHLNRTVSQSSSKSDSVASATAQGQGVAQSQTSGQARPVAAHLTTSAPRSSSVNASSIPNGNPNGKEIIQTPTSAGTTGTSTGTMYTPTSTLHASAGQTPTSPNILTGITPGMQAPPSGQGIQSPPSAMIATPTLNLPKIPSIPVLPPLDVRFSQVGSDAPRDRTSKSSTLRKGLAEVDRMPVIHSDEGHHDNEDMDDYEYDDDSDVDQVGAEYEVDEEDEEGEEEDEEYERESLHAESFVTAGTNEDAHPDLEQGMELSILNPKPDHSVSHKSSKFDANPPEQASPVRQGSNTSLGESRIFRRWNIDGHAPASPEPVVTSPIAFSSKDHSTRWPFRPPSPSFLSAVSKLTPAFWTFWLGFIFPVLWLIGGWHFTNAGELPPRVSIWEWYFWRSTWSISGFFGGFSDRLSGCCGVRAGGVHRPNKLKKTTRASHDSAVSNQGGSGSATTTPNGSPNPNTVLQTAGTNAQRRRGKRRSGSASAVQKARAGQVYPALPRWVAEKQRTDDGRMRLNDPKRSLRGISFGYPFIERPPGSSQDSTMPTNARPIIPPKSVLGRIGATILRVLGKPNRVFDLLYGVKLIEVRGRPESGRRMFDPWVQRCRYALCYALLILAAGLCTASVWLIVVNTRKVLGH